MGDLLAWLLFFFVLIIIIVIVVYQLMCLADLEFDYINPYDSASRINKMIMPEFITQGVLCFLYLITGHWFMSLLSVPYLYYNVRVMGSAEGNQHENLFQDFGTDKRRCRSSCVVVL
ncbi:protein cornichon homolog 4-like isoform X2 [Camellia sinensis]|uniref:protein cornichon homolog 4-like isoform X2 n=1 Tax=Camellia sinensis TaxID=4442 RepID=UPI0010367CCF|nr:protein cornichon homolog 4-like isoform X2 [Camellia sinensis]